MISLKDFFFFFFFLFIYWLLKYKLLLLFCINNILNIGKCVYYRFVWSGLFRPNSMDMFTAMFFISHVHAKYIETESKVVASTGKSALQFYLPFVCQIECCSLKHLFHSYLHEILTWKCMLVFHRLDQIPTVNLISQIWF